MLFNPEEFDIKMETEFIGRNFFYFENINSTNSELLKENIYSENGTIALADYQTEGRGRMQRKWESEKEKNLTFSILFTQDLNSIKINLFNLCAGLAVVNAIDNLFQLPAKLKWPNDILISNRKVAGLLLESVATGNIIKRIVIGFGINVNQVQFPSMRNLHPTSLKIETKKEVSREKLLSEILNQYEELLSIAKSTPEKIIHSWKEKCLYLGEQIKITVNDEQKIGMFEDIDDEGFLLLKTDDKIEKIYSGEII